MENVRSEDVAAVVAGLDELNDVNLMREMIFKLRVELTVTKQQLEAAYDRLYPGTAKVTA
jgi:hypothetical protein